MCRPVTIIPVSCARLFGGNIALLVVYRHRRTVALASIVFCAIVYCSGVATRGRVIALLSRWSALISRSSEPITSPRRLYSSRRGIQRLVASVVCLSTLLKKKTTGAKVQGPVSYTHLTLPTNREV